MKKGTTIFWLTIALLIVGGIAGSVYLKMRPGQLDSFAQCIADSGATYYGAFWCPHCQAQNRLFGNSKQYLPYVECSTPDGRGQTDVCIEQEIASYPTWEFADGERFTGELTLAQLSERTGCELPE